MKSLLNIIITIILAGGYEGNRAVQSPKVVTVLRS